MGEKNAGHAGMSKHFYRAAYMSVKSVEKIRKDFLMYARRFPQKWVQGGREEQQKLLLVF